MTALAPVDALGLAPYKLRGSDFLILDRSGAFRDHARTELLAGEIFYMNAQHRPHGRVKMRLYEMIVSSLRDAGSPLAVLVEVSVALGENDVPEPDLTLTSEPDGDGLIPGPSVALVIEVSDTTLADDLGRKQSIYAAAGVPEYWVADVNGRVMHRMSSPTADGYAQRVEMPFGTRIDAATIAGLSVETTAL